MASYEITVNSEQLSGLLTDGKGLQGLVETVLNQVLEAQGTAHLGAQRHERSPKRKAFLFLIDNGDHDHRDVFGRGIGFHLGQKHPPIHLR